MKKIISTLAVLFITQINFVLIAKCQIIPPKVSSLLLKSTDRLNYIGITLGDNEQNVYIQLGNPTKREKMYFEIEDKYADVLYYRNNKI